MKLYLLRHATTNHNIERRYQGKGTDIDLNNKGIEQAKKTANYLKKHKIDIIYSSPLKRAMQTANIINKHHKKNIKIETLIIERDFGKLEGLKYSEVDYIKINQNNLYDIYQIEKQEDFQKRIIDFFNQLHEKHFGKNILIVTHGGVIKMLLSNLQNIPWQKGIYEIKKDNSAISIIEIDENKKIKSMDLNKKNHLK
jgi:alpha-ribazole phosphatase/probable phosphoglycerate mutase